VLAGVTPPAGGLNSTATCWRYQDDYSCIAENHIDYCAAIKATKGARWSARPATARHSMAPATNIPDAINAPTSRHRPRTPTVVELNTSYTITSNTLDTSQCTSFANSTNCVHAATTCTDSTPCKTINGLQVCLDDVSPPCRRGAKLGRFLLGRV
jgi:conjugal transfer mating pair stabilization protein TraN